jgi:hypothetical protein
MTVYQMIRALSNHPPDADVYLEDDTVTNLTDTPPAIQHPEDFEVGVSNRSTGRQVLITNNAQEWEL